MNSITNTIVSFCNNLATQSSAIISAVIEPATLEQALNPAMFVICFLTFLTLFLVIDMCVNGFIAVAASMKPNNGLDMVEEQDQEQEIELVNIRTHSHMKRPSSDDQGHGQRIKSPKLMLIEYKVSDTQNIEQEFEIKQSHDHNNDQDLEHEQSILEIKPLQESNHHKSIKVSDQIPQVTNDSKEESKIDPAIQETMLEAKWYLRWDLSSEELESLSYSEKVRRFYILSNCMKRNDLVIEPSEPPESQSQEEEESFSHDRDGVHDEIDDHDENNDIQIKVNQQMIRPIESPKPINYLSTLIFKSNSINIPQFQIDLLKMNQSLTLSLTNRLEAKKFDYSPQSCLKGKINFSNFMKQRIPINLDWKPNVIVQDYNDHHNHTDNNNLVELYKVQCDLLDTSYKIIQRPEVIDEFEEICKKIIPGKPLNQAQLRNILYIIS